MTSQPGRLIVGIGSAHGEDQVGWLVAEEVRRLLFQVPADPRVDVRIAKSPLDLLNWLDECGNNPFDGLLICDACRGPEGSGSVRRWIWPTDELKHFRFSGTHDFGLAATLTLADQLGRLPPVVAIWGIPIDQRQTDSRQSQPPPEIPCSLAREMLDWQPDADACQKQDWQSQE